MLKRRRPYVRRGIADAKRRATQDVILVGVARCDGWATVGEVGQALADTGVQLSPEAIRSHLKALVRDGVLARREAKRAGVTEYNLAADAEGEDVS